MSKKNYAIMGATGHIGQVLSEKLLEKGHQVLALGRDEKKLSALKAKGAEVSSPSCEDPAAMAEAFRGKDAVFTLIPPYYADPNFSAYQDRTGQAIATALSQAGVKYAVSLSSIGADKPEKNGPIGKLFRQEKRLEEISGLNVIHLRASYFMENLFWSIPVIKGMGIHGTPIRADLPIPMVATKDIGVKVAEFMDALNFKGAEAFEFAGPTDPTMAEVTSLMGKAIGKPDLKYVQFPYEDAKKGMMGSGMNETMAGLMIEMNQAFNEGRVEATQTLDAPRRGKTTVEEFLKGWAMAYNQG